MEQVPGDRDRKQDEGCTAPVKDRGVVAVEEVVWLQARTAIVFALAVVKKLFTNRDSHVMNKNVPSAEPL